MSEKRRLTEYDQIAKQYIIEVTPDITQEFASKKYREINILLKANLISNLNMEFKVSLHVLCDLMSEMISFDKAILYLWDNDLKLMNPYIKRGFPDHSQEKLLQGNSFAEWCMQYGKTFLIPFSTHPEVTETLEQVGAKSMVSVPIYETNNIVGTLQLFGQEPNDFTEEDAKLLWHLIIQCEALFRNYEMDVDRSRSFSTLDDASGQTALTHFYEQLEREIGRAERRKTPMSILLIEIDQLNEYTRQFGHLKAEQAINEVGSILMNQVRQIDMVSRYGENRFAMILTETDRKGGLTFGDRLLESVSRHLFQDSQGDRKIHNTLSAGLVTFPFDAQDKISLIHATEQALQKAKELGGNRVNLFPDLETSTQELRGPAHQVDLDRVTQTIHSIFNFNSLLELVVNMAMESLHAEKGSLLLSDQSSGQFIIKVATGFGKYAELIKNTRVPVENTITGWVATNQKPLAASNIEEIGEVPRSLYKDYLTKSFLSIPLISMDKTIGMIHLSNKTTEDGIFTEEDLLQILPLSKQLTDFLIEGIRFEETQKRFSKTALASLAAMLEAKDPYVKNHSKKVTRYTLELAKRMNMSEKGIEKLLLSARLHDIGKIAIRDELFNKKGKLSDEEMAMIRRHPFFSWKILDAISAEDEEVKNTILQHHEKLDGSGFPYGLVGDQIPLPSRILCIADTFVGMTSERAYRAPFTKDDALKSMKNYSGIYFDSDVLDQLADIVQ